MKIESIGWQGVLGPSVSDRDSLVKLSELLLAFIIFNPTKASNNFTI